MAMPELEYDCHCCKNNNIVTLHTTKAVASPNDEQTMARMEHKMLGFSSSASKLVKGITNAVNMWNDISGKTMVQQQRL